MFRFVKVMSQPSEAPGIVNCSTTPDDEHDLCLDPIYISFVDNALCYPDKHHYLYLITGNCHVLEIEPDALWLKCDENLIRTINSIDIRFAECRSDTLKKYLNLISQIEPNLRLSLSNTNHAEILKVRILNNTEQYGEYTAGCTARLVLSANYNRKSIIWNAVKIKFSGHIGTSTISPNSEADDQEASYFQECQLEEKLIKI